jgi:photosystem II stability/assembly factor-like uncharacterized protein
MNKPKFKILLVFLILISFSAFATAQSIWEVVNPSPPNDEYVDIQFVDEQTGYAVGEDGNVIKTIDGGLTWEEISSYINKYNNAVFFHDENNGWIAGKEIYKTIDGGNSWEYSFGYSENEFMSLFFISEQVGFVGGLDRIFKTINGGDSWEMVSDFPGWITELFFIDDQYGWASTWDDMLLTTDGGESWSAVNVSSGSSNHISDFQFLDENIGYLTTYGGLFMKSENGGVLWDTIASSVPGDDALLGIHFFDESNARILSEHKLYITEDGGITWIEANLPFLWGAEGLYFYNENLGSIIGEEIYMTYDGGYNWELPYDVINYDNSAICFGENNDVFVAADNGIVIKSTDNGNSWIEIETATDHHLTDICYVGNNTLWAVSEGGKIVFSTDNGESWELKEIYEYLHLFAISFGSPENGCTVGENGNLYVTNDSGETWTDLSIGAIYDLNDVAFANDNTAYTCGSDGLILKTMDGGNSWTEFPTGVDKSFTSLCFIDENTGWFGAHGLILLTQDGCQTFDTVLVHQQGVFSVGTIRSIYFSDSMNGWAVSGTEKIYHTSDGGQNWVIHETYVDYTKDIIFRTPNEGFIVARHGNILYTNQGTYLAPRLLGQPADTNMCEFQTVELECQAIGDSLKYQWLFMNEVIPGAIYNPLVIDSISNSNGGLYACIVSNAAGSERTENFIVSIKPNAQITGHPQDKILYENDTVIFNLAVSGALPISYQWQKNGEDIPGAIYSVYPIYGTQLADSGYYRCVVSNDCKTDTTHEAYLTVLPASAIDEVSERISVSIVPNPVKSSCRVLFDQIIQKGSFEVYSTSGIKVKSGELINTEFLNLDLHELNAGIYLLQLVDSNTISAVKFIKE